MPATSPLPAPGIEQALASLGAQVRARRKALSLTATAAARAAGVSRVTWHRIERGQPSVTMGAYANAMLTLGLAPAVTDVVAVAQTTTASHSPQPGSRPGIDAGIRLTDYPELRRLAWQLPDTFELTSAEALGLYERHWRHLDETRLSPTERALLDHLRCTVGKGHLLV